MAGDPLDPVRYDHGPKHDRALIRRCRAANRQSDKSGSEVIGDKSALHRSSAFILNSLKIMSWLTQ
jgi:hypothetical protein